MGREHLASLIEDMRRRGRETAVVEHRGVRHLRTSYGEVAELAGRFAAELRVRKIGAGDRVVLWGANSAEWVAAFDEFCAARNRWLDERGLPVTALPEYKSTADQPWDPSWI